MNATGWHSIVQFTMPFDSLYSRVNNNIFRFQVHRIAKDLLRNWLQTNCDTFRMTRDTDVEIPYWLLDFWDLTLLISYTTEFSEKQSELPKSIVYFTPMFRDGPSEESVKKCRFWFVKYLLGKQREFVQFWEMRFIITFKVQEYCLHRSVISKGPVSTPLLMTSRSDFPDCKTFNFTRVI
jgi:hypothetical protein